MPNAAATRTCTYTVSVMPSPSRTDALLRPNAGLMPSRPCP